MILHKSATAPPPKRNTRTLSSSRKNEAVGKDLISERFSAHYLFYWNRPLGASPNSYRLIVKPKKYQLHFGSYWALSSTLPELLLEIRKAHRTVQTLEVWQFHSNDDEYDPSVWDIIAEELKRSCIYIRTLLLVTTCHSSSYWTRSAASCATNLISAVRHSVQLIQLGVPPAQSQPPSSPRNVEGSARNVEGSAPHNKNDTELYCYEPLWIALNDCVVLKELCIFGGPPMEETDSRAAIHTEFFQTILPRLQSLQLHNVRLDRPFFEKMMECVEQYSVVPRLDHMIIVEGSKSNTASLPPFKPSYSLYLYLQFIMGLHSWRWNLLEKRESLIQKYLQKQRLYRSVRDGAPARSVHAKEEDDDTFGRLIDAVVMIVRDWYREKHCAVVAAPPRLCTLQCDKTC
jgi:hypothetical protein